MRIDTAITRTKTRTTSSNHCSQFSKLRPEFARLRRSSGWRESCSQRRARVADLRAQIVATMVKVMVKPMSTMAESLKKRRNEGIRWDGSSERRYEGNSVKRVLGGHPRDRRGRPEMHRQSSLRRGRRRHGHRSSSTHPILSPAPI